MRREAFAATDRGLRRHHNEDSFLLRDDLGLYVVADGMGGHAAGEVASELAIREVETVVQSTTSYLEDTWPEEWDPRISLNANRLARAILAAHRKVTGAVAGDVGLKGMGSTIVAILADWERNVISLAHVGDSRVYVLRHGTLELLTSDHSWVHEQVLAGLLSEDAARNHPLKNVVTRALGGAQEPAVDIQEREVAPEETYLLCSDGLNTMLDDSEITDLLTRHEDLSSAAQQLIFEANRRGGVDNITVLLVRTAP
ncbi:MAG: PP2C family protein-serine/threonine phosphatase [Acidobacteriota bacterium]